MITQAIVLCGGLGTRLGSLTKDTPKPMLHVGGKPILAHVIEHLKAHGITNVVLGAGYKADVVEQFFNDLDFGIHIDVFVEQERLGTAGALWQLRDRLDEDFLLVYGDVFLDFDLASQLQDHEKHKPFVTFLTGPSTHPWDSNLIEADEKGNVTAFVRGDDGNLHKNIGDRAVYVVSRRVLEHIPAGEQHDLMKEIYPKALAAGERMRIHEMDPGDFVRDMGKPERFPIVERHLEDRKAIQEARARPKKITTAFLDRDGVLNELKGLLHSVDNFTLLPGVPEAVRMLNDNGIATIVVTNQPVIARGLCPESTLLAIHEKMRKKIAETSGGKLDAIYFCPHHPETQHGEGVKELRRGCDCRKPGIGMLMQARREHGIDLAGAIMIGDSSRDIGAGRNAGVRTILIGAERDADYTYPSLLAAVQDIVAGRLDP